MKAGESFQLTESWWKAGKPLLLTATGLGAALRAFQTADQAFQGKKTGANYAACIKALNEVDKARKTTIEKCGKTESFKTTKDALGKAAVIEQRKQVLKLALAAVMEKKVADVEQMLQSETRDAVAAEQVATKYRPMVATAAAAYRENVKLVKSSPPGSNAQKAAADKMNKARDLLQQFDKILWERVEKASVGRDSVTDRSQGVSVLLSPVGEEFPAFLSRLRACIKTSQENTKKLKLPTDLYGEYESLFKEITSTPVGKVFDDM